MENNILTMSNIRMSFSGVEVLHDVNFSLRPGEVHAIIGENGAGKSTMLKILSGVFQADSGEIYINGEKTDIQNPAQAHKAGFSIIYQELVLAPGMSVYENILLGNEPHKALFYNRKEGIEKAQKYLKMVNVDIDPREKVSNLSIAIQQLVEIARAIALDTKIIAMDEPTSSLTESEIDALFKLIARLKAAGHSIIYVSHRMEEIFKIADRVTVLRDGCIVDTLDIAECTKEKMINLMAGKEFSHQASDRTDKDYSKLEKILEVRDLTVEDIIHDINFDLYKGEVLGLAGLVGSGRTSILCSLMGLINNVQGEVIYEGRNLVLKNTKKTIKCGIGLVPEDRKLEGLCLNLNIRDNISIAALDSIKRMGFIDFQQEKKMAEGAIEKLYIRPPSPSHATISLSGGNQQKIVLGKWLAIKRLKVFLLDEPTRGIDVTTKFFIHRIIRDLADAGMAVIVASSELPEILELADRIIVMKEGGMSGELKRSEATKESILHYAF